MIRSPADLKPVPIRRYRYSRWRWRILVRALDAAGSVTLGLWRLVRPLPKLSPPPRRILIVQLDHLGDAVLSSPMFPRLKAAYPDATIDVLASPSNRELFEADPHVDRVHLAERNWFERRPAAWALGSAVWTLGVRLRSGRYDLGIDVRGDVLTVLVLAIAGIPRRLGWAMGGGGFLLTDVAAWVPDRHEVQSRLALLECLGLPADGPARVVAHASDDDRARVGRLLAEPWPERPMRSALVAVGRARGSTSNWEDEPENRNGLGHFDLASPLLVVHLGAGTPAKRWPLRHWRTLIARFLADGWRVVVVGGPEEIDLVKAVEPHPALRDWTGRLAVTETAALLERADLFLGADSGPAHLAACAGVPSVILFSGTNRSRQWRPWSRQSLVLRHRVPCSPCHQKVCPLAGHPCLSGLTPERVHLAARRWWARTQRGEPSHAPQHANRPSP
ncbi:MAG: glycosyltransferase family 9 protein [Isosphaeraceae bacterium]